MEFVKLIAINLVSPLKFSFLLLVLGSIILLLGQTKFARILFTLSFSWILLWSQPYVSDLLLRKLEYEYTTNDYNFEPDYILVFACFYNDRGNIPEISRWSECSLQRNTEAARLHFISNAPIIVTGGEISYREGVNYSDKAKLFFQSMNISTANIITTRSGTNTHEEIVSAAKIIENKNLWVVSSATHIYRIDLEITDSVGSVQYFPVDYHNKSDSTFYITLPSQSALESARYGLYETLALLKYRLLNE